jgi:hypothetical protein
MPGYNTVSPLEGRKSEVRSTVRFVCRLTDPDYE